MAEYFIMGCELLFLCLLGLEVYVPSPVFNRVGFFHGDKNGRGEKSESKKVLVLVEHFH